MNVIGNLQKCTVRAHLLKHLGHMRFQRFFILVEQDIRRNGGHEGVPCLVRGVPRVHADAVDLHRKLVQVPSLDLGKDLVLERAAARSKDLLRDL